MNLDPKPPDRMIDLLDPPLFGDRSLFPDLNARIYLNHAAISPPSSHVIECAAYVPRSYARLGVDAFGLWIAQRDRLRATLARLIGAHAVDIGLVPSTTMGIVSIAMSMNWRPGDRIILFEGEFPTNITPWQRAAEQFQLELCMLTLDGFDDGSGRGLERLEHELRAGARLVACSAVQFQTGLAMPLQAMGELCHQHDCLLSVDAIQAAGVMPIDVIASEIDFLISGSHKWLMGLEGCGFVYVAPQRMASLIPRMAGWLSHEDGLGFLFSGEGHLRYDRPIRQRADWLEMGAQNTLGFAALEASVDLLLHLGLPAIYAHTQKWIDSIEPELLARGFQSLRADDLSARSGILSLKPPRNQDLLKLSAHMNASGVSVSTPDGCLRLAPHWPNDVSEIALVLDVIDHIHP
jgi:cysteine desulfurase/selenocysteine lyase